MLMQRIVGRRQRGLSLVELMVGITVGLFVVAAAATLVSLQLNDNRHLTLETQVQQDLRASADIIARDLRRAGIWSTANGAQQVVWRVGDNATSALNPNLEVSPTAAGVTTNEVDYRLSRLGSTGPWGVRLQNGVIEVLYVGIENWQPLTDPTTMKVTRFDVTPQNQPPIQLACQKQCASGPAQACWPTLEVRAFQIDIEAVATSDASVRRSLKQLVHLRNDAIMFHDPADPTRSCPQ